MITVEQARDLGGEEIAILHDKQLIDLITYMYAVSEYVINRYVDEGDAVLENKKLIKRSVAVNGKQIGSDEIGKKLELENRLIL